jgi:dipeptidyl aminopeptidase/acylaminoacyl peptidase
MPPAPPTTVVAVHPVAGVVTEIDRFDRAGRALPTRVLRPATGGPYPLFVWAHGFDATVDYFAPLLRAIAARGYVVAAPTFPHTRLGGPGPVRYGDYVNQPADVSFVIRSLLARHPGLIDPRRIAVGGHSLGAVTTMGLVANRCCLDPMVSAAVEVDGSQLRFPEGTPVAPAVPVLFVHGAADTTFPVAQSQAMYAAAHAPKFLVVIPGAPHTAFRIPADYAVILRSIEDFLDAYVGKVPGAVARVRAEATQAAA